MVEKVVDKNKIEENLQGLAQAIFAKTKISIEAGAQSVIPSIPQYLKKITLDIATGPADKINEILRKLQSTVNRLGIDLGKYSKGLEDFSEKWTEKQQKAEEEINELKKKGIVAEMDNTNEVNILSKKEIAERYEELDIINAALKTAREQLEKDRKTLQTKTLSEEKAAKLKDQIRVGSRVIGDLETARGKSIDVLGPEAEERRPGLFGRVGARMRGVRESVSNFGMRAERYVPRPIMDIASSFKQQLTAPFEVIKDFGSQLGEFVKPLRLVTDPLKKLGKGLGDITGKFFDFSKGFSGVQKGIGNFGRLVGGGLMRGFTALTKGLMTLVRVVGMAVIAFAPFLLIAIGIVAVLGTLFYAIKKITDFFGGGDKETKPGTAGDMAGEMAYDDSFDNFDNTQYSDREASDPKAPFYDPKSKQIIQPDNPDYYKIKSEAYPNDPVIQKSIPEEFRKQTSTIIPSQTNDEKLKESFALRGVSDQTQMAALVKDYNSNIPMTKTEFINNQPITTVSKSNQTISSGLSGTRTDDLWLLAGYSA